MSILDKLIDTIPLVKEALNIDAQICLTDREKTIGVWPGKTFRMDIPVGTVLDMKHPGDDMMIAVIETGKGSSGNLPEFIYGVPTNGILTPVFENGEVVGVISAAVSIKAAKDLDEKAEIVSTGVGEAQIGVTDMAHDAENIAERLSRVEEDFIKISDMLNSTTSIVKGIQSNSKQSNMIALNASIEAARVGEAGRGFTIVAKEMGNLAKSNNESSSKITSQIQEMMHLMEDMKSQFADILQLATNQVATTEEMAATLEDINVNSTELAGLAQKNINIE